MAHPDNGFYGHRSILADAIGSAERPIYGQLQHGWDPGFPYRRRVAPWLPKLVWNDENARAVRGQGFERVEIVGAPFLYLREHLGLVSGRPEGRGTLVYPFHSTDREQAAGSHERYADEVREREGPTVTMCLYWVDYENAALKDLYQGRGFDVICHGRREDPAFLRRQAETILRHRRVVSNRVSTAVWYAASMARQVEVYGAPFVASRFDFSADEVVPAERAQWPELFDGGLDGEDAVTRASRELGADWLRDRDALSRMVGWEGTGAAVDALRVGAVKADYELRRAGYFLRAAWSRDVRRELGDIWAWSRHRQDVG